MKSNHKKILVAMSGGVDSSVAACLLKQKGFEVGGATIRTWASGDCAEKNTKSCCGVIGVEDARAVAWSLDIPYYVFNFEREFKVHVVDYFSSEYLEGRTPNPCIACNQHIKFSLFLKRAQALGYEAIATGHYARLGFDEFRNRYFIREGTDPAKDQSYVLFPLPQEVLSRLYLPVGDYSKSEIRAVARKLGLGVSEKPDSEEICFIPSNDYGTFLERQQKLAECRGPIRDRHGNILGEHRGYYHYTIGQRRGLRIPFKHALYVTGIIPAENAVIVGTKEEVGSRSCRVERINWFIPLPACQDRTPLFQGVHACVSNETSSLMGGDQAGGGISASDGRTSLRVQAKIRSRHAKAWATMTFREFVEAGLKPASTADVVFDEPQEAITPGQACVFYEGEKVLGGGWIASGSDR